MSGGCQVLGILDSGQIFLFRNKLVTKKQATYSAKEPSADTGGFGHLDQIEKKVLDTVQYKLL